MTDIPTNLRRIRHAIAELQQDLEIANRQVEVADAALALRAEGKNEGERKARLVLLRAEDPDYLSAWSRVDWVKAEIKRMEADEAYYSDLRRADEWEIRRRRNDLLGAGADDTTADEAVDDIPF